MNLEDKRQQLVVVLERLEVRINQVSRELQELQGQQLQTVGALRLLEEMMREKTPSPPSSGEGTDQG